MSTATKGTRLEESRSARFAMRCASWAEKWFPDSWVFAVSGIFIVVVAALAMGAPVQSVTKSFGSGFWSLIPFTMQMAFVVIGGSEQVVVLHLRDGRVAQDVPLRDAEELLAAVR